MSHKVQWGGGRTGSRGQGRKAGEGLGRKDTHTREQDAGESRGHCPDPEASRRSWELTLSITC